jgi:magnesium-transporting ATPase (P-type)
MCFDKTGTLTENAVQVNQVYKIKDAENIVVVT